MMNELIILVIKLMHAFALKERIDESLIGFLFGFSAGNDFSMLYLMVN